jgi:hypothetical protein
MQQEQLRRHVQDITGEPFDSGPLFAVGGALGPGRILVLADHSLFINQMTLPSDTGNLEFAYNCLEWLREGGRRHQVLFVEEGVVRTDLKVPLKEVDLPLQAKVAVVDQVLAHMEEQDIFNRMAWDFLFARADRSPSRLARWGLELLTILVLVYAGYRIALRARHKAELGVPLLAHAASRHTPAVPLLEQRYQAVRQAGNLWETAHHLARSWFAALGTAALDGPRPPRLVVRGGWWRRRSLRRRFQRLWCLARGTAPFPVGPRHLRSVLTDLGEVKAALAAGELQPWGPR